MFSLPKNSKIVKGKTFGTKNNLVLNIYRWNRDNGKNPSINTYHLNKSKMGPMLLDAITVSYTHLTLPTNDRV